MIVFLRTWLLFANSPHVNVHHQHAISFSQLIYICIFRNVLAQWVMMMRHMPPASAVRIVRSGRTNMVSAQIDIAHQLCNIPSRVSSSLRLRLSVNVLSMQAKCISFAGHHNSSSAEFVSQITYNVSYRAIESASGSNDSTAASTVLRCTKPKYSHVWVWVCVCSEY